MATLIIKEAAHGPAALHGTRAGQLAAYITDPHKCGDDDMRSGHLYATTVTDAAREMAAICDAADGTGKRKLIQHWILSTKREGKEDHPSNDEIMAAGRELMAALGYSQCPHMIAVHNNTDNRHAHIVVARVDAETGEIVRDSHSHLKAQKAVARISAAHGWRPERGNMYQIARDGEIVTRAKAERDKPRRGDIRTRTTADDAITPATPRQKLEERLAEFAAQTRDQWGAWKWGDLHRALALRGIEMQYTDHGQGRGGLAYSADGRHWVKASSVCPAMSYPELSKALGARAGSYRKARKGIAQIVEDARARIRSGQGPELSCPAPQGAEPKNPRQDAAQDQPGAPRAPEKKEREIMTDAQRQYLALRARERADERTRDMLDAMARDELYTAERNAEFLRENEAILQALYDKNDADAYARLHDNAARYHLRLIVEDTARQQRDAERTAQYRRQYRAYRGYAARYAGADANHDRITASMLYQAGAGARSIAARMVDGMFEENERKKNTLEYITEQICRLMDDIITGRIYPRKYDPAQEALKARIAYIEDYYGEMSAHAPKEHQDYIRQRMQEEIAGARALYAMREERERRREERTRKAQAAGEQQRQNANEDARIKKQIELAAQHARIEKHMRGIVPADLRPETRQLLDEIVRNIKHGRHAENKDKYADLAKQAAILQTSKEVTSIDERTTPEEAAIYARHEAHARAATTAHPEKMHDMIALRMRVCGHHPGETVRVLRAGGMDARDAMIITAGIYHTDRGDNAVRAAQEHADRWKREERGEDARRNGGRAGATQAQRPAQAPAAAPRM